MSCYVIVVSSKLIDLSSGDMLLQNITHTQAHKTLKNATVLSSKKPL